MKKEEIKIGYLKWYGGYNSKTGHENHFGFINKVEKDESIFFHKKNIRALSHLIEQCQMNKNNKKIYVAFEIRIGKDSGIYAEDVRLLSEMEREEIILLLDREERNIEKVLCSSEYEIYQDDLIRQVPWNKLSNYDFYMISSRIPEDSKLYQVFLFIRPEYIFENHFEENIKYLYYPKVRKSFLKNYQEGRFDKDICFYLNQLMSYKNETIAGCSFYMVLKDMILSIDWRREECSSIIELELWNHMIRYNHEAKVILSAVPRLILESEKICKGLTVDIMMAIQIKEYLDSQDKFDYLLKHIGNYEKKYICSICDIQFLVYNHEALQYIEDEQFLKMIKEMRINWASLDIDYISKVGKIIRGVEADIHKKTAMYIAEKTYECETSFHIFWWQNFSDSVKVRILLYLSNFWREWKDRYYNKIKEIYEYERCRCHRLILSLLKFLSIIYSDSSFDKQNIFLGNEEGGNAHEHFIKYIIECFNSDKNVTHELRCILEKCHQNNSDRQINYFCDAKDWRSVNGVFCPKGYERPDNGYKKCNYRNNLADTQYKNTKKFEHQCLTDYLMNIGFHPDLTEIGIMKGKELSYSYKISAWVNRLIEMKERLKCHKCKNTFIVKFEYSMKLMARLSATRFSCIMADIDDSHDHDVYINFCINKNCDAIIDSRECKIQDRFGYYVCPICGSSKEYSSGKICPECGEDSMLNVNGSRVVCRKCKYQFYLK